MTPAGDRSPAFAAATLDILSNVLMRAGDPSDVGSYLTEEMRELTGARCVLLVQYLSTPTEIFHRVVSVNPLRRRGWAEASARGILYEAAYHSPAAQLWRGEEPSEVAGLLKREGFELSIGCPLDVGGIRVGSLLALGLPDQKHVASVFSLLSSFSTIVALVLRNAVLYEKQEQLVQERTAELREKNAKLQRELIARQESEEALRASEERFRRIVTTAVEGIWALGPDMKTTFVNSRMAEILGYSCEEMVGRPMTDFMFEEDAPDYVRRMEDCRQGLCDVERRFRHRSGRVVWTLASATATIDAERRFRGSFAMFADITERKQAEEAVQESERRLNLLVQNSPVGIAIHGADGELRRSNAAAGEMLGLSERPIEGRRREDMGWRFLREDGTEMPPEEYPVARVVAQRQPLRNAVIGVLAPGTDKIQWRLVNAVPLLNREGRLEEVIVMFMDITHRKRVEEELKEAARRKDEFMAMLGHELRNPLAPIQNASYILKLRSLPDPRMRHAQEMIARQVLHLTRIVDDLLDVSRISRGKITLQMERVDFVQVVRMVAGDLRDEAEAHGLSLSLRLPNESVWVWGDPTRLSQMVSNLLLNAIKFTDPSGRIDIEVTAPRAEGGSVTLSVQDTGIGMNPQTLARLFTPFVQAEAGLARSRGGLGLGLALVKGLASLHRGTVEASSEGLGCGSRFSLRLPASVEKPAQVPSAGRSPKRKEFAILVVEDNLDAAESLQILLEVLGHRVRVAGDGVAALATARTFEPEVIICDIGLPGRMDGYAVARAVRADPTLRSARLIALTGYGQGKDKQLAREAGFDAHITKPASAAVIEQFLQG